MSALVSDAEVTPASLIPQKELPKGLPGLDRIGQRYSPGLQRVARESIPALVKKLQQFGLEDVEITPQDAGITSYANWCEQDQPKSVLFHYRAIPISGGVIAVVPVELVNHLVDLHFGGTGENCSASETFSPAERLYLDRFALDFVSAITGAWAPMAALQCSLKRISIDGNHSSLFKPHELITQQPYEINLPKSKEPMLFQLLYPVAGLKAVPALTDADGISSASAIDPVWFDSLNEAIMRVGMPLRTVFARPEISVKQLMSLKAGDVVPIFMPSKIPISIAGRLFAHGTVGESNNRVAIKIEEVEQGNK